MTTTAQPRAVRVAPPAGALSFLPGADYADAFTVAAAGAAPARRWAVACLAGGAELPRRVFGTVVWHGVLGFDLAAPGTPDTLVGWRVVEDTPNLFVLRCDGRLMDGAMVFARSGDAVTWTTALRYRSALAPRIWALAQHAHRALAPRLLSRDFGG